MKSKILKGLAAFAAAGALVFGFATPAEAATGTYYKTCPYNQTAGIRVYNSGNSYTYVNVYTYGGSFRQALSGTGTSIGWWTRYRDAQFRVTSPTLQYAVTFCQ